MRVLIVEDNPDSAALLKYYLDNIVGVREIVVVDGVVDAIMAMATTDPFGLAIVDYRLSRDFPLTGLHVARWLHEANPLTHIVLISASARYEIEAATQAFPDWLEFLDKPFPLETLKAVVVQTRERFLK